MIVDDRIIYLKTLIWIGLLGGICFIPSCIAFLLYWKFEDNNIGLYISLGSSMMGNLSFTLGVMFILLMRFRIRRLSEVDLEDLDWNDYV